MIRHKKINRHWQAAPTVDAQSLTFSLNRSLVEQAVTVNSKRSGYPRRLSKK